MKQLGDVAHNSVSLYARKPR